MTETEVCCDCGTEREVFAARRHLEGVRCPKCEGERNGRLLDHLAELCAAAQANPPRTGQDERSLELQLASLGHNFPHEFVKALVAGARNAGRPKRDV